jgi:Fe-S cluster assembly iron-binding protein IscA
VDKEFASDFATKAGELRLLIDKGLLERTGAVTIDFKHDGQDSGFVVETEKIPPPGDGGCDGCSGCFY